MAPNGDACVVAVAAAPFFAPAVNVGSADKRRRRPSSEALHRTVSDVSYELHSHKDAELAGVHEQLPPVTEVENAKCECCGMSEECTPDYIRRVRAHFSGRWVCGLCAEAVKEETGKNGGLQEEALREHMGVCKRFNGFGRTHPVLFQAEAMREILRKHSRLGACRSKSSISPREVKEGGRRPAVEAASPAAPAACR